MELKREKSQPKKVFAYKVSFPNIEFRILKMELYLLKA